MLMQLQYDGTVERLPEEQHMANNDWQPEVKAKKNRTYKRDPELGQNGKVWVRYKNGRVWLTLEEYARCRGRIRRMRAI